jgi:signal transduction histidine kinase
VHDEALALARTLSAPEAQVKILAVDDRSENLMAMEAGLQDPTYKFVKANSGKEALQRCREEDFAVILLDVQMPIMDGYATAKLIRKDNRSRFTPIIFVTANHDSEYHERLGYEAGAVDYLFKPLNIGILKAKVAVFADLFRKNREIQQQAMLIYARDEFLSIASHELKTPITPLSLQMQSFINLVDSDALNTVPREKIQRMLKNAFGQVERLTRLIDELLDVSRLTAGKLVLHPDVMSLSEMVQTLADSFAVELKKSGCQLRLDLDAHAIGRWDRFRLEQVFINLLTNAVKYGPGEPIHASVTVDDSHAYLSVKDHGIGIAKEDQSRIFDRFERAASPRHFGGLGLGLYIASQIVKLHHGEISVQSDAGAGALFEVRLPLE